MSLFSDALTMNCHNGVEAMEALRSFQFGAPLYVCETGKPFYILLPSTHIPLIPGLLCHTQQLKFPQSSETWIAPE